MLVLQPTEVQGELEIQTGKEDDIITAIDLSVIFTEINIDTPYCC